MAEKEYDAQVSSKKDPNVKIGDVHPEPPEASRVKFFLEEGCKDLSKGRLLVDGVQVDLSDYILLTLGHQETEDSYYTTFVGHTPDEEAEFAVRLAEYLEHRKRTRVRLRFPDGHVGPLEVTKDTKGRLIFPMGKLPRRQIEIVVDGRVGTLESGCITWDDDPQQIPRLFKKVKAPGPHDAKKEEPNDRTVAKG